MPIAELPGCQTLLLRREGWRLHVTLNRPAARNAMSFAMVGELRDLFIAIAEDRSLRAVILRGAEGNVFKSVGLYDCYAHLIGLHSRFVRRSRSK